MIKFLLSIWSQHTKQGEFVFVSSKDAQGNWEDFPLKYNDNLKDKLKSWIQDHDPKTHDIYFCPLPFKKSRRKKKLVPRSKVLWADLDEVDPRELGDLTPSIYWRTSPGKFQGLWILNESILNKQLDNINKRLTYHTGADKGGWNLGQVIRIPGTHNRKYSENPKIKLLNYSKDKIFDIKELDKKLDPVKDSPSSESDDRSASNLNGKGVLKEYYEVIPEDTKELLMADKAEGDRSAVLWRLENELYDLGLSPPEIIALVRDSVWNKYKHRDDQEKRLRTELLKILKGEKVDDEETQLDSPEKTKTGPKSKLIISDYPSVAGGFSGYPGWLVDGFWSRQSHGIVAGEPKSFKSTLTLDLAVSVASGEPFLGKYDIEQQGPVVMIQNENAEWIVRDRLHKIMANRNLGGKVYQKDNNNLVVDFPPELPLHFINQQMFLFNDKGHRKIVEKLIDEYNPVLLIFDPLYLMFSGDVSSAQDLNPILNWFLDLKNQTGTGIMLVHHWNKAQNSRRGGQKMLGSTTLHGWVESAWYIGIEDKNKVPAQTINEVESVPSQIVLEREFRSAGTFPKVDMEIEMGEMGEPQYDIKTSVHGEETRGSDTRDIPREIKEYLKLRGGRAKEGTIVDQLGVEGGRLREIVDEMVEKDELNKQNNIVILD